MNYKTEIRNPITLNTDFTILNEIEVKKLCLSYSQIFNIDIKDYFKNITTIYLCKCNITQYKFFFPFTISGDELFYKSLQDYEWYYQADKWEFEGAREIIQTGSLLEIGCGEGHFLNSIKHKKNLMLQGIEYNQDAIIICQNKNLKVDKIELSDLPDHYYDYLVCFQVLEHIVDLKYFFENARRLIKPSGKIIIGVPNTKSLVFNPFSDYYFEHGSLLLNMPPHHMGWWDQNSLKNVAKYFGFRLIKTSFEPLPKFRRDLVLRNFMIGIKQNSFEKISNFLLPILNRNIFKGETILSVFEKM